MYLLTEYQFQQLKNSNVRKDVMNEIETQEFIVESDCRLCIYDGHQSLYPSGCTGCGEYQKNFKRKEK
jgi:hypothetical protein